MKTRKQKLFELKYGMVIAFGMGMALIMVGMAAEIKIALPHMPAPHFENLLPLGMVLVVLAWLVVRRIEKIEERGIQEDRVEAMA
jgi:hypothetical protein